MSEEMKELIQMLHNTCMEESGVSEGKFQLYVDVPIRHTSIQLTYIIYNYSIIFEQQYIISLAIFFNSSIILL